MAPWLRLLEGWAVEQLLRTPGFHRAVEQVAKNVHRVRNGLPREEKGGTSIEREGPGFGQHFYDELKTQLGRAERSEQNSTILREESKIHEGGKSTARMSEAEDTAKTAGSDSAWQDVQRRSAEPPKQGFMAEYMDALRTQLRNDKSTK